MPKHTKTPQSRLIVFSADPAGELDRTQVHQALIELEAALFRVGGKFQIVADREIIGYTGGEPVAVTKGYVIEYQSFSPARHAPGVTRPPKGRGDAHAGSAVPSVEPAAPPDDIPDGNPEELLTPDEIQALLAQEQS